MDRNKLSYKVGQYMMFAGVATVLFCAVVIVPFIYGIYLTFTSWDGVSLSKPFVGFANYAAAFSDMTFWSALLRTVIYSVISVVLINIVAFLLAYMVTRGIRGITSNSDKTDSNATAKSDTLTVSHDYDNVRGGGYFTNVTPAGRTVYHEGTRVRTTSLGAR